MTIRLWHKKGPEVTWSPVVYLVLPWASKAVEQSGCEGVWWGTLAIPALGRLRLEDGELEASLVFIPRAWLLWSHAAGP